MESTNPVQRLAEADLNKYYALQESQSILAKARAATAPPEEAAWTASHAKRAEDQVSKVLSENKIIRKANEIKGSGKSPLATPMSSMKKK